MIKYKQQESVEKEILSSNMEIGETGIIVNGSAKGIPVMRVYNIEGDAELIISLVEGGTTWSGGIKHLVRLCDFELKEIK